MSPKKREEFLEWHAGEVASGKVFSMQKEIHEYCVSDVDILRRCCLEFRNLFKNVTKYHKFGVIDTGVDPFENCITIAAACNLVFRRNFLQIYSIAVIPPRGYDPKDIQSKLALRYLAYVSQSEGVHIQHAKNKGEVWIGPYKVDGFCRENKTVYEFNGCWWHGCARCYEYNTPSGREGKCMGDLHLETVMKKNYIKKVLPDHKYVEMWSCEWKEIQKGLPAQFTQNIHTLNPHDVVTLNPREAFYGGRTNANCLYYECGEGERIRYVDFTSLYPSINKYGSYPLGHPEVITSHFQDVSAYYGLVRCKVLPPKSLLHPVLPIKINGKLMFPLCRTCAETRQRTQCNHGTQERLLQSTWVSLELMKAVEKGYRVLEIESVWHFPRKAQYDPNTNAEGLFTSYINTFLKIKQEASGWPEWVKSEEDKAQYVRDYYLNEGIRLEPNKIVKNKGLRSLSKLMLNSFWGRFGMRTNLPSIEVISCPKKLYDMLTSDQIIVTDLNFVTEEVIEVKSVKRDEFEEVAARSNVVIAAFTTAQARLKLYDVIDRLDNRVLYFDTDSVVYVERDYNADEWRPALGDYLGELTDELDGHHITTFCSGGPKNYAYQLENGETHCKVKGITLNYKNSQLINFDTMRAMVRTFGTDDERPITVTDDYQITKDAKRKRIETKAARKDYRVVYDKRVVQPDFSLFPTGMSHAISSRVIV
ncbi:uncharacterized protein [Diadema antillarum]|uniref:uncharacterized protein n=1 Tax=Diadema antillarum TaxID=105358 RepID=UPI003A83A675